MALMVVGIALLGVITATVATFFVSRLQDVKEAEECTEATLADVVAELREVRTRLDALDGTCTPDEATANAGAGGLVPVTPAIRCSQPTPSPSRHPRPTR